MKKTLVIGLAASAILISCNRDEVIEINPDNAIDFKNAFVDNSTKAGDVKTENIAEFYVSAVMNKTAESGSQQAKVFVDQKVTKSQDTWTYTPAQYWYAGWDYDFIAVNLKNDVKAQRAMPVLLSDFVSQFTIAYDNTATGYNGNEDLVYVHKNVTNVTDGYNTPVALSFSHALSRVRFEFTNGMGNPLISLKVKDIKITDATGKGTFTVSTKAWSATSDKGNADFTETVSIADGAAQESGIKYLIPDGSSLNASFTVEVYNDNILVETKTLTAPITFTQPMAPGTSYKISATVTNEALKMEKIEFSNITVEIWGTDQNIDITPTGK